MNDSPRTSAPRSSAGGIVAALYGGVVYAFFFVTFLYAIGFVGNLWVPKSVDTGAIVPLREALAMNVALLTLFALQHSIMARPVFKRWWTRIVPHAVERSTYVLFASAILALLCWQWRPITDVVWDLGDGLAAQIVGALFWVGWATVLASTFLINHFELFGVRQVFARLTGRAIPPPVFRTPLFYRRVRHPIYLGFMIAFWAAPIMTAGHLMFAVGTTMYILLGIFLEERDLIDAFGEQYRRYRAQVRMLVPLPKRRGAEGGGTVARPRPVTTP
jgi:protein-S-isoprenylcysteine O-methyltransferase Ste14